MVHKIERESDFVKYNGHISTVIIFGRKFAFSSTGTSLIGRYYLWNFIADQSYVLLSVFVVFSLNKFEVILFNCFVCKYRYFIVCFFIFIYLAQSSCFFMAVVRNEKKR